MSIWLVVALGATAGMSILFGTFLAGSQVRRNLIWAACMFAMGVVVWALLLAMSVTSSFDIPRAGLDFNPLRIMKRAWETRDYIPIIEGLLIGSALPVAVVISAKLILRQRVRLLAPAMTVSMAIILAGLFIGAKSVTPTVVSRGEKVTPSLTVPPGFTVEAYLPSGLYRPTSIDFDSMDRLFVGTLDGVLTVVTDSDGDDVGDEMVVFARKEGPILGIEVIDDGGTVYLAGGGDVLKLVDHNLDGVSDDSTRIIGGLPSFVYDAHSNNGLELGPDGRLYMTLGGTSSFGREEHPLAGSILVSNPDGSGLQVYARGFRNPYDLTFTSTGLLVVSDNGPERGEDRDELNLVEEGGNYGYPEYFGFPPPWSDSIGPIAAFPRHSVPTGTIAYKGANFPFEYHDRIFQALFGSPQVEAKVVFVTLVESKGGIIRGVVEDFAVGLKSPIDIAVDSKGRLYIADFDGRQVYQVTWDGVSR